MTVEPLILTTDCCIFIESCIRAVISPFLRESKNFFGNLNKCLMKSALIDLACLSFNIKIVPVPANTSVEHLKYILNHSGITHLFVDGAEQVSLTSFDSPDSPRNGANGK